MASDGRGGRNTEEPPPNSICPASEAEWRAWLAEHHERADGVWLIRFKAGAARSNLSLEQSIRQALCFGWIDSLPRALDDERTMLYFAPRKPGSNWSRLNRDRVEDLEVQGLLEPAGIEKIEAARADGSWSALDAVDRLEIPADLQAAFDRFPGSREEWDGFPPSIRRGILEWILNAKRPATRLKRLDETASLAKKGERANQWPRKGRS